MADARGQGIADTLDGATVLHIRKDQIHGRNEVKYGLLCCRCRTRRGLQLIGRSAERSIRANRSLWRSAADRHHRSPGHGAFPARQLGSAMSSFRPTDTRCFRLAIMPSSGGMFRADAGSV